MLKRITAMLLCAAMVISMLPAQVFAGELEETVPETTVQTTAPAETTIPAETTLPTETAVSAPVETVPDETAVPTAVTEPEEREETAPATEATAPETEATEEIVVEETVAEEAESEELDTSAYAGKVISILGDSISTFAGYIPVADGFNLEHLPRYPQDNLVTDVNETWWMQVINRLDAKLGINDSWRGATVSGAAPVTTGTTGENAAMANLTRIQNLGSNGTPDVILFYGGTNDLAHVSKVGTFDAAAAPQTVDLTTKSWDNLADGYVHTLLRLKHFYPDAVIVALLPTYTASYYTNTKLAQANEVLAQICDHYCIAWTDLRDSGVTAELLPDGIHPGPEGMDYITEAVLAVLKQCEVAAGENTVYPVAHSLTNVKASLGHYKGISSGEAFSETLTGDNLSVTVTMGGRDITGESYADGKIYIPSVTGSLVITVKAVLSLGERLQTLPEKVCGKTNLWPMLEPVNEYYTVSGWGVHASGKVRSVTVPVTPGDQLWATSFGASGENGGTMNGIRLTWFSENGLLKTVSPDAVYGEFAENGYITVPETANAVNVVMWTASDSNEFYILNLPHSYENSICSSCGKQKNTTAKPLDEGILVTATPENYLTISNPATEKLACAPSIVTYGDGKMAVAYLADDVNTTETESSTTIVCRLGLFNLDSPQNGLFFDVVTAGQTIGDVTIGLKAPYEPNLLALEDGKLLVLFNIRDTSGKYIYYSATFDPESKTVTDYTPLTLDGKTWIPANIAASYNAIADNSISSSGPAGSMVFTSQIVTHGGYYYGYCGGICSGFSGILVRSTDGINWTSVMAPKALPEMAGVIECGFQFMDDCIYFCMRDISSGVYQCSYDFNTGEQLISTHKLSNLTTSKPTAFTQDGKLYLIANKATGDDATIGRRNTALFYEVDPETCRLTLVRQIFCADGCAYHSVINVNGTNYWAFHTDARRISPYTQGRSNLAFREIPTLYSHVYESVITVPTCTEQGYTTHVCTICGGSYVDSYVEAAGHRYENNICTGCGKEKSGVLNLKEYSHMYASGCITVAANVWQTGVVNYNYQIPLSDFTNYNQVTVTANSTNKSYIAFFTQRMTKAGAIAYANGWTEVCVMEPGTTQSFGIPADAQYMYILNNNAAGDSLLPESVVFSCSHTFENGICTICGTEDPNPYGGKTIACIGDSITYGVGVTRDETDYVTVLAEALEMDYIRLGASGTTLCTGGHATCNIGKLTEENLAGADVVTVLMGINDFVQARNGYYTLGTFDSEDTSTIYGAAHMWCQKIAELRQKDSLKDTEFYFMTPVITSWNNSVSSVRNWDQSKTNVHGYTLRDLCNAIIAVCASYEIPVIDLNLVSGLYYNSAEDNNIDQFGGDGAHPGETGHRMMAEAIRNYLLKNNLREDHDHSFGSWVTTTYPDCNSGEQQRVCSVCSATESKTLDGTGHTYENGVCTSCSEKEPVWEGKVVSILGGSTCTFAGFIPVADGFNLTHRSRYPQDNLLTDVNDTWWMQVVNELGAKLGINDSWAGSQVLNTQDNNSGDLGPDAAMASLTRIQNLGSNGTPDVILFYGAMNDIGRAVTLGSFVSASAPTQVDLATTKWDSLADAYVAAVMRMQYYYPDTQIVAILPGPTAAYYTEAERQEYCAVLKAICDHYGELTVDLSSCGLTTADMPDGTHPNAQGMDYITAAVLKTLLNEYSMESGENVVHTVTHKLSGAKSSMGYYKGVSHGRAFSTEITGETVVVTVTMDGVDITEDVYANGVVTIPAVTGDVVITAKGVYNADGRLQQLPHNYCCNTNLWAMLEPVNEYYTASGWGTTGAGNQYSVTFPVTPGDKIWATSFGSTDINGFSADGVRITWFGEDGVLESLTRDKVYAEFADNGYISVPDGAMALNIPMASNADTWEIYILSRDHSYEVGICTACGGKSPELKHKTISILGASISTYEGTSNGAAANTTNSTIANNVKYYPNTTIPEVTLNDTWWMQVASDLDLRLLVNNAWSGSAILLERAGTVGAYVDRCVQLHDDTGDNAGETPDIICIQMGFNDFSYGKDTLGTADIDYDALITADGYGTPATTMEATAIMLDKIAKRYPDAEVYMFNHFKRIGQSESDTALMEKLNADIAQVCGRFGVTVVDLYTTLTDAAHIGDGRLHPNRLGMDVITEAMKTAILANTAYTAESHRVTFALEGVTADYGTDKQVLAGDAFTVTLRAPVGDSLDVTVTMGGEDITASAYGDGTVAIASVTADVTVTAKAVHVPQDYRWEFDGTDLACVYGENELTKTAGSTANGVFSSTRYTLDRAVVLSHREPWVVEWRSEGTWKNTSGNGGRMFTTTPVNADYNARYIFKSSTNGLIAMGEKTTTGSHNYGIALGDHGIDWTVPLTYRLENRIADDGSNMIYLFVDGKEIGPMVNYFVGTASKNTTSDWLSGKDFIFGYIGTDSHGLNNCSIDYIQIWENGHTHRYDETTHKCDCGAEENITVRSRGVDNCTVSGRVVTVKFGTACRVGYWAEAEGKYIAIKPAVNSDGSYSFTAPEGVREVLLVIKGDTNLDGKLMASDVARLNAHALGKMTRSKEEIFAADVSGDGNIFANDGVQITASVLGKMIITWG